MYKKNTQSEELINTILQYKDNIKSIYIEDTYIFAEIKKDKGLDPKFKSSIKMLYSGSNSDVFNIYEELIERLNFNKCNISSLATNLYKIYAIIPKRFLEGIAIEDIKLDIIKLYDMFLENKENSPMDSMKAVIEQLKMKYEFFLEEEKSFSLAEIEFSTSLDKKWLYWNEINNLNIKDAFKGNILQYA